MRRSYWMLLGLLLPLSALAHGGVDAAKRNAEMSMLVTGEIAVNPDGSVYGYSLDHRDKLPAPVVKLIGETLPRWKFTPVKENGRPVLAKALMSLRIVGKQIDPKHDAISVGDAEFGAETPAANTPSACAKGVCLTYLKRSPPDYPANLVKKLVTGTVYLVIEVDRQGKVANVAVSQVDLRRIADGASLGRWRREFGRVSMAAARNWTFQVPRTGPEAGRDHWTVIVPVDFAIQVLGGKVIGLPDYGKWDAYVPGPVNPIPWAATRSAQLASKSGADAVPDNGVPFVADSRFVLLTPVGGDAAAKPPKQATSQQG